MGLEQSNRLKMSQADRQESEAAYKEVRSGRLPVVQGRANYMRLSDNIPSVDFTIPGTDSTFTVLPVELNQFHTELSIQQPLFTGGRLSRQIEAAGRRTDAAILMEQQEQAEVAFEIRQAYWNLYRAQATTQTLDAALEQVDEHLRDVGSRVEEGTALQAEMLRVRTRRSEVRLEQVEARSRIRMARLELNRLIGLPSDTETQPIAREHLKTVPYGMEDLTENALGQRPDLHAMAEQVRAQETEVEAVKNGWLPEISLVGRYVHARPNQYFFAEQDQFRGTWEAGVALRWNIWSGGQRVHQTERTIAQLRRTEAGFAERRDQIKMEVAQHYLELERAMEAMEAASENIEAAEEAYRSVQNQYNAGTALSSHVLDAEYDRRTAQARYVGVVADYEIAQAALLKAIGQVWGGFDDL